MSLCILASFTDRVNRDGKSRRNGRVSQNQYKLQPDTQNQVECPNVCLCPELRAELRASNMLETLKLSFDHADSFRPPPSGSREKRSKPEIMSLR